MRVRIEQLESPHYCPEYDNSVIVVTKGTFVAEDKTTLTLKIDEEDWRNCITDNIVFEKSSIIKRESII